jgi:nicotinate-nucleotide adenylyltransferase
MKSKNNKIGLFFGSFNPITNAHIAIAEEVLKTGLVNYVWFIISPQNPDKKDLLDENIRLEMARLALFNKSQLYASDFEFALSKPSYTCDTLILLKDKNKTLNNEFYFICGTDVYESIHNWKGGEKILQENKFIVYNRGEDNSDKKIFPDNVFLLNSPKIEISSTYIRNLIKENKSIKNLTPDIVVDFINKNNLYKK